MWKTLRELPLTILRVVSDGLERSFSKLFSPFGGNEVEADEEGRNRKSGRRNLLLLPVLAVYWLFRGALWAITFPVQAWFLPRPQRACFLRGLPAFLTVLLVIAGAVAYRYYYDSFLQRYTSRTIALLSAGENNPNPKSTFYAKRIVSNSSKPRRDYAYIYGVAAARANRADVASATMEKIAPDDEVGFAQAHQYRAGELASMLKDNPQEQALDKLQWHLEKAGKIDEERSLAIWAQLYQARGEWDQAAKVLEQAGNFQPGYLMLLADLKEKQHDSIGAKRALERARESFLEQLEKKPDDKLARIQCVIALKKLNQINEAEKLLLAGLQLHRDADMQRALADFYVLQFDATSEQTPFIERFSWLARALTIDINFPLTYARLALLFQPQRSADESEELKTTFEQILVTGANPSVAHFALGFLAAQTPETQRDAIWHLTQAQNLQPPVALAYSNLAKSLAECTPPRFAEAELFARQSISGTVQEAPMYLTLGKVLASQAKWSEVLEALVTAVEKFPESAPLHQALAQAYEATGDTTQATAIREIADRLENNAKPSKNAVSP